MTRAARSNSAVRAVDAAASFVSRKNGFKSTDVRGALPKVVSSPIVPSPPVVSCVISTTGGTIAAAAYYYKVSATNATGETLASMANKVTTTGSTSSVAIVWPVIPGATGYKVYRGTVAGSELLLATIGSGATNTYTDTGAVTPAGALPTANTTNPSTLTVTFGGTTNLATGNTVTLSPLDTQKFSVFGAPVKADVNFNMVTDYSITSPPPIFTEFYLDEPWLVTRTQGGLMTVLVDGEFVAPEPFGTTPCLPSDGTNYYHRFDFPATSGAVSGRKRRRILIISNNVKFGAIIVPATATVQATPKRPKLGVVPGDSITEPTITDNFGITALTNVSGTLQGSVIFNGLGYAQYLNFLMPDWDIRAAGSGGTGYLNPNAGAGRVKLFDRLADVTKQNPDAYFHANGINDGSYGYAAVYAEARKVFRAIKVASPNAEQWVLGPFWSRQASAQSPGNLAVRDALEDAAAAEGATGFVDVNDFITPYGTDHQVLGALTASVAANANSFLSSVPIAAGVYVKIGQGALGNTDVVFTGGSTLQGSGAYLVTTSGGVMPSAHNANEPIRLYGPSSTTGTGNQGSPSGLGNSDRRTGSDATHPTSGYDETGGHKELARRVALCLASRAPAA